MEMTIERLRQFRGIQKEVIEIQREIDTLYFPISSPNGHQSMGSSMPGNPTERAVNRIIQLQEKAEALTQQLAQELEDIETWLDELEDHELRAIIRAHYLLGDSWSRCTQRILNYEFSDTAKKRVYRYFGLIK
jgi:hypothetical protein